MPRRGTVPKREVLPDPLYNSALVTKFINSMTYGGKRQVSQAIMYDALNVVQAKTQEDPLKVFKRAVDNVKPSLEVKSRRVGGSNYQVPVEVNPARRTSLALRWIIGFARRRPERTMTQKLAMELLDAANMRGGAIKKKEDTHKMAEANKAFAHYRW
jgi:small subunit ribosomal protein S7